MERAIPQKKKGIKHKRTRTEFTLPHNDVPLLKYKSEMPDHNPTILTLAPKLSKNNTLKKTTSAETSIKKTSNGSVKRRTTWMPTISENYGSMQSGEAIKRKTTSYSRG